VGKHVLPVDPLSGSRRPSGTDPPDVTDEDEACVGLWWNARFAILLFCYALVS